MIELEEFFKLFSIKAMDHRQAFKEYQQAFLQRFEGALWEHLPKQNTKPIRLHQAMHYALNAGGKRLRPLLLVLSFEHLFESVSDIDPMIAAVAIECIHTYSLIHDDLPAIDNSPMRRGKPSCHAQFDEATAILAGDALLTCAFELLSTAYEPTISAPLIRELSVASGSRHLIGGQMEDIESEGLKYDTIEEGESRLKSIERGKTASLISASLAMGGILAATPVDKIQQLKTLGECLGMGFQIADDLLDATGDAFLMGKPQGQDAKKLTYVALYGIEPTRKILAHYLEQSLDLLKKMDLDFLLLRGLVYGMLDRSH